MLEQAVYVVFYINFTSGYSLQFAVADTASAMLIVPTIVTQYIHVVWKQIVYCSITLVVILLLTAGIDAHAYVLNCCQENWPGVTLNELDSHTTVSNIALLKEKGATDLECIKMH